MVWPRGTNIFSAGYCTMLKPHFEICKITAIFHHFQLIYLYSTGEVTFHCVSTMPFLFTEAVKIEKEAQKKQIYSKQ
jgi:hypothetical protein